MNTPEEISLNTERGKLAGLALRTADAPPVLCLHGWLDNAASFTPLLQHLTRLNLVAIDMAGHGHSAHRHPEAAYYFTEYLMDVDAILDALGWSSCHLLGHSLGGAVASLYAAASPERVLSVTLLDALGPITAPPEETASRLRKSIQTSRLPPRRQRNYSSIEQMIRIRQTNSDLSEDAARLLCERSVKKLDDHHVWSNDPELHWVSPILPTEEQALDCLQNVEAPVFALLANPRASHLSEEALINRLAAIQNLRHQYIDGKHHFHMHQAEEIAPGVQSFILEHNPTHSENHE